MPHAVQDLISKVLSSPECCAEEIMPSCLCWLPRKVRTKESWCTPCAKCSTTALKSIGSILTIGLSTSCLLPAADVLTHAKVAHMATVNSPALHPQVV